MSELQFPDVSGTSLIAEASLQDDVLTVHLSGVADQGTQEAVAAVTAAMNADAVRLGVATAVVDLRGLEFMSSSCLKSLLTRLAGLQQGDSPPPYVVKFVLDADQSWQHRTADALRRLAPDVVSVEA